MKTTLLKFLLPPVLLAPLVAAAQAPSPVRDDSRAGVMGLRTERDNELKFLFEQGVRSIEFTRIDSQVTAGESLSAVTVKSGADHMSLHVFAGRTGSEDVAKSWRAAVDDDDRRMVGTQLVLTSTTHPEKLNFWVAGAARINGVELRDLLYVGQGHHDWTNNWWLAGRGAVFDDCRHELRMMDGKGQVYCFMPYTSNQIRVRACESLL